MSYKVTIYDVRHHSGTPVFSIGYCKASFLLCYHEPVAYTAGIYGWNFDVYKVHGVTICTGYRGMPGEAVDSELVKMYEDEARKIRENNRIKNEDKPGLIDGLLAELCDILATYSD